MTIIFPKLDTSIFFWFPSTKDLVIFHFVLWRQKNRVGYPNLHVFLETWNIMEQKVDVWSRRTILQSHIDFSQLLSAGWGGFLATPLAKNDQHDQVEHLLETLSPSSSRTLRCLAGSGGNVAGTANSDGKQTDQAASEPMAIDVYRPC